MPDDALGILRAWQRSQAASATERTAVARRVNALFAAEESRVYATCRRMVGDPERARELAQDVMTIAFSRLETFDTERGVRFSTWLYGIARHTCQRAIERRRELLDDEGDPEGTEVATVLRGLLREERAEAIGRVLAAIPPDLREVMWLRHVEGLGRDAICELLELDAPRQVTVMLQRAKRACLRELEQVLAEIGHRHTFFEERP